MKTCALLGDNDDQDALRAEWEPIIEKRFYDALERYIKDRIPTGHFLAALLSNDLTETFARADDDAAYRVKAIIQFCYNHLPSNAWGSPERVRDWLYERGGE